jgi:hypothetical protein
MRGRNHIGNKMKAHVNLEFVSSEELSFGAHRVKIEIKDQCIAVKQKIFPRREPEESDIFDFIKLPHLSDLQRRDYFLILPLPIQFSGCF